MAFLKRHMRSNFSKFYFQGTGDVDGLILNKGHSDDFHSSSGGKIFFLFMCCSDPGMSRSARFLVVFSNFIGLQRKTILSRGV